MSYQRPGPDIGSPMREHQVITMLFLLSMCGSAEELAALRIGLHRAVMAWGWSPNRLEVELDAAKEVLIEYKCRFTLWFDHDGALEFDYNCEPPDIP
ncbi:MAG TPA: hypothetical protein VH164_00835 [Ktedonobacteraceae bacterium]|nr:hypothetical protein [Ktedonobacteraceae bacterium]